MSSNLIKAIINIVNNPIIDLSGCVRQTRGRIRVNNMGERLEEYIKDAFAGTISVSQEDTRNEMLRHCFSYMGNQNNPPDMIITQGDAIEVKKIEHAGSRLPLNSSYPKAKLFSNSSMITEACRNCEPDWVEKDIIYAIGVLNENVISQISFIYGTDYAASKDTYERIADKISAGVSSIPNIELAETRELGKVNRVDPLGITSLRIRGMWQIENPLSVFNYAYTPDDARMFNLMAIINIDKYRSFQNTSELESLAGRMENLSVDNVRIKSPDNPVVMKEAKLITFSL